MSDDLGLAHQGAERSWSQAVFPCLHGVTCAILLKKMWAYFWAYLCYALKRPRRLKIDMTLPCASGTDTGTLVPVRYCLQAAQLYRLFHCTVSTVVYGASQPTMSNKRIMCICWKTWASDSSLAPATAGSRRTIRAHKKWVSAYRPQAGPGISASCPMFGQWSRAECHYGMLSES